MQNLASKILCIFVTGGTLRPLFVYATEAVGYPSNSLASCVHEVTQFSLSFATKHVVLVLCMGRFGSDDTSLILCTLIFLFSFWYSFLFDAMVSIIVGLSWFSVRNVRLKNMKNLRRTARHYHRMSWIPNSKYLQVF